MQQKCHLFCEGLPNTLAVAPSTQQRISSSSNNVSSLSKHLIPGQGLGFIFFLLTMGLIPNISSECALRLKSLKVQLL